MKQINFIDGILSIFNLYNNFYKERSKLEEELNMGHGGIYAVEIIDQIMKKNDTRVLAILVAKKSEQEFKLAQHWGASFFVRNTNLKKSLLCKNL